jgi:hypothetical protein
MADVAIVRPLRSVGKLKGIHHRRTEATKKTGKATGRIVLSVLTFILPVFSVPLW